MEGLIIGIIIALFVIIIVRIAAAVKFEEIAEAKGHRGYFAYCFILGIAGYLMVVALPDNSAKKSPVTQQTSTYDDRLPPL